MRDRTRPSPRRHGQLLRGFACLTVRQRARIQSSVGIRDDDNRARGVVDERVRGAAEQRCANRPASSRPYDQKFCVAICRSPSQPVGSRGVQRHLDLRVVNVALPQQLRDSSPYLVVDIGELRGGRRDGVRDNRRWRDDRGLVAEGETARGRAAGEVAHDDVSQRRNVHDDERQTESLSQVDSNCERPLRFAIIIDSDGTYDRRTHTEHMPVCAPACTLVGRDHPDKGSMTRPTLPGAPAYLEFSR